MALYDHIQELRAELRGCTSASELRQIERELKAALAEHARHAAAVGLAEAGEVMLG